MRSLGGVTAASVERATWDQSGAIRNLNAGDATVGGGASISDRNGRPSGYLHPRSWAMPIKGGGMAARRLAGALSVASDGQAGYPMDAALSGALGVDAALVGAFLASVSIAGSGAVVVTLTALGNVGAGLTATGTIAADGNAAAGLAAALTAAGALSGSASASVSMISALAGAGSLSGDADGAALIMAALAGSGTVSATSIGAFLASAGLTGAGAVVVTLTAPASIGAALAGSGALGVTLTADANITAELGSDDTTLSPDVIASAVWAHGTAVTLAASVELIRQISDNRLEVDIAGQRLVLYDDDGTTELRAWALATDGGEDVATASGVQTKRGAP